ncbi:MotA/TolQ/ExbB proton channel family protein [Methylacidimicrobium sp. B4]|uniref:MotA/TolQ/ExbB proton channel family protein n=1 Tax=Methylacidimicrobium sp. B4 TaxID=2796139 RepID=UPI001A8F2AC8|nr:MotA/TolQ/ExbB proton channel family protein [Methylacidimicrobium sp. B4]QSR84237.1 MotA/TolQ/ExbB proton channel family protein [Methylacidimicrobium sp. B4]
MMMELFFKGGPIMWPIAVLAVVTAAVLVERAVFILQTNLQRDPKSVRTVFDLVGRGAIEEATSSASRSKDVVAQVLGEGLRHRGSSLTEALAEGASAALHRFHRGLVVLDTAVTLGPLLGLLGTVTGMMRAFSLVGGGELAGKQAAITGGVAESLLAVCFGLGVAIVAIVPLNFLNARAERVRREIEASATRLEMMLAQNRKGSDSLVLDRAA